MAKEIVVNVRLPAECGKRLERLARRLGCSTANTAALLVDEGLRSSEFPFIEFRNTPTGRQAYLQGTRLPVWRVVAISRAYNGDGQRASEHLEQPLSNVMAALNYAEVYPEEIPWLRTADEAHPIKESSDVRNLH